VLWQESRSDVFEEISLARRGVEGLPHLALEERAYSRHFQLEADATEP
jgi:hypothetical protein